MNQQSGLALDGIGVRFGGLVALDGVTLRCPPGRILGVIGPNGAGKTTLFNVVCGFVRPTSGTITLDGRPLRPRPHRLAALGIGRTLQGVGLFAGLSVVENVMIGASHTARAGFASALLGLPRSDRDERRIRDAAMELLAELGIAEHADASPGTLPYALRKKVSIARALAAKPRLLLLDEPAGGLGADEISELQQLVAGLPARDGGETSVMLVEHHMDFVMSLCDEVVVLDFGRVIATGSPQQVRDDPAVAEAYLGAVVESGDQA
ncbi:branched-chain amino acid transport system ATP-binding protein [Allocatelliglobosispora scoriae]|uniref:Branched-chain amino acid transport system ATP-binding protein n=1 Tax=Allocatelliglobosispora scoriae TaxID=643052 RepID=A0A841BYJ9_9ACTN|nr:ABC transporter ATP-binding protein [Allocatelliglobosispora scoriae]MBB5872636.1 branched-chain amino acid transport system ATP-binding protein [Allocatelliglobosispora scoriae]